MPRSPSGASTSLASTSSQGSWRTRSTTAPSSAYPMFEYWNRSPARHSTPAADGSGWADPGPMYGQSQPGVMAANPAVWARSCRTVRSPATVPGRYVSSGSSVLSSPRSRNRITSTAVKDFVRDPIRYCVSRVGGTPRAWPRTPVQAVRPSMRAQPATDGTRPWA
ncbi:hypothetical protein V8J11_00980 [Streptomyces hygroscopicus subsp. hygroscopicus]